MLPKVANPKLPITGHRLCFATHRSLEFVPVHWDLWVMQRCCCLFDKVLLSAFGHPNVPSLTTNSTLAGLNPRSSKCSKNVVHLASPASAAISSCNMAKDSRGAINADGRFRLAPPKSTAPRILDPWTAAPERGHYGIHSRVASTIGR
jgi:hypothetical protein